MKRFALSLAIWLLGSAATYAADSAELNILGFSADEKIFAFEQFGTEDGSGFPYSEIYVVDTSKDEWVKGSPIKVRPDNEDAKLVDVIAQARAKYAPLQKSFGIAAPAQVLARHTVTEPFANRKAITFDTWFMSSMEGAVPDVPDTLKEGRYTISVAPKTLPGTKDCPTDMGDYAGFTLSLHAEKDHSDRVLFADDKLPASRGCPMAYDMQAVVTGMTNDQSDQMVAIVGVYTLGFEGKDLRYMAVPFKLNP